MAEYQETITSGGPTGWQQNSTYTSTPGTLASRGLYRNIAPPRQSQAQGISGTDERAYTRQVTNDELVRNQMNQQLADNSLYMQLNERDALRRAMSRGVGNSSIAVGAGRRAAIESAMPIALADAATYGRTQAENMEALNRGLMQERDIANQQSLESSRLNQAGMNAGLQAMLAREGMAADMQRQRENLAFSGEQSALDRFQQQQMAQFGLGADLVRGTQQYGFQRGLNEQGYQFDLGRMGQQFRYEDMAAQRDFRNSILGTEYGMRVNLNSQWQQGFMASYFADPTVWNPADLRTITQIGPQLYGSTTDFINQLFGRGG